MRTIIDILASSSQTELAYSYNGLFPSTGDGLHTHTTAAVQTMPQRERQQLPNTAIPTTRASTSSYTPPAAPPPAPPAPRRDPHSTDWHDVDLLKFTLWMSLFSTAENAIFYPFYLVKTREQADRSSNYRALDSFRYHVSHAIRTQGIRKGLYRGFVTSSVVSLPAYGLYMGVYTWTKERLGFNTHTTTYSQTDSSSSSSSFAARHPALINFAAPFIAGIAADAASIVFYVPGDVIVQRLQMQHSPYKSFPDAVMKIWRTDGITGFYRGFYATFLSSAIASAIWWMVYENSKARLYALDEARKRAKANQRLSAAEEEVIAPLSVSPDSYWEGALAAVTQVNRVPQLLGGFIAGTVTSTLMNPLDVVKTRLQVQDAMFVHPSSSTPTTTTTSTATGTTATTTTAPTHKAPIRYRGVLHGFARIYVEEGLTGYVRGVMPKLLSRGPLSAMSSVMYELVLYLSRKQEQRQPAAASLTTANRLAQQ